MIWTEKEVEFLRENPDVFEQARNPRDLVNKISGFTKYFSDIGQATKMAFAWAEAKGGYGLALKFRKDAHNNTLADIYLSGPANSTYRMNSFYTKGDTGVDLLRRVERYFDSHVGIANPSAVFPVLWESLSTDIPR
jgi:hypothetical protein